MCRFQALHNLDPCETDHLSHPAVLVFALLSFRPPPSCVCSLLRLGGKIGARGADQIPAVPDFSLFSGREKPEIGISVYLAEPLQQCMYRFISLLGSHLFQ